MPLLLSVLFVKAQFGPPNEISKSNSHPSAILSIDLDDDGNVDILTNSQNNNKVVWFKNLGSGVFSEQKIITNNAMSVKSVYAIDIDSDGLVDVLSASSIDDKIAWYKNLGNGVFGTQQIISLNADGAKCVYAIDIDRDGFVDVISASYNDDKIAWYKNLGAGVFGVEQIINIIDTDGNPWNASNGNADGVSSIFTKDLDNDGDMDVLFASIGDDKVAWYKNNGDGTFHFTQEIITNLTDGASSIHSSDIDNDGDFDLVSTSANDGIIAWHENLGGGIFISHMNVSESPRGVFLIFLSDLTNDGKLDVISASFRDNKIVWFKNLGNGNFGSQQIITSDVNFVNQTGSIYSVDIDNDGDYDVLSASGGDNKIAWYRNIGNGVFDATQQIITTNALQARSVYSVDIDNDGDFDVLSASWLDNKIAWYENLGNGIFGIQQNISTNTMGAVCVYGADLDNDGDFDVLSGSAADQKIAWFENLGNGLFGAKQILADASGLKSVTAVDLNSDGSLDILYTLYNADKIIYIKNLGGGLFDTTQTITSVADGVNAVFLSDINGDGNIDIIASENYKISWYENFGDGTFGSQQTVIYNFRQFNSIFSYDIDEDGDFDVISASWDDDKISWYENFFGSPYKLIGNVFYDGNQNQHKDTNEIGLDFIHISLFPNNAYSYTNDGYYSFTSDSGTFTVNHSFVDPFWSLTTDSLAYTVTLSGANPIADSLDFGFYPNTITNIIKSELTGAFPRCNDTINYWANIRNEGTTTPNGILHLQLDDSISFISSVIAPDSIVGQHIYWHFDSLFFYAEEMINLQVQMPPFTSMGDTLTSILNVYELDGSNNIVYTNSDTLNQVLVCAYDPNDKTVLPKGTGSQGFIANNQPMEYLIRFQNTGNDTALTVMVRDQLDDNLDWSSLKPLASSHPMQVWIEQDGEAVFKFENIMLLDSNVDFLGSQGFVKFSINQKPNLAPNTPIFNTGHIYFDYNPAVITNTVLNTIDDTTGLPVSVQEITFTETNEIIVFPNPFTEFITIYYKAKINTAYHVSLYDMSGKELLKRENITNNKTEFDVSQLKNGIYIIVGTDTNGKKLFSERIIAQ